MKDNNAIVAKGLSKQYGELWALRDVDFAVPAGSVLGLLGHNGAGKTTAIRILTTLAEPTSGEARVAGFDVATEGARVRERIGVAGQSATVDDLLTARANLEMVGRLYHLPKAEVRSRADELLEQLGLADVGDRLVKTFSGGMRRRLDLAASLVADPPVLFLDEPTTGLDPEARVDLWSLLRELVRGGTTLLLTTQYLDEADQLGGFHRRPRSRARHRRGIAGGAQVQGRRGASGDQRLRDAGDRARGDRAGSLRRRTHRQRP